jgi:branched-chain amino acid transport system permease protein
VHALELFLQLLVIGIQVGSVYALIAVGYTMVYGVLRFINFAHGDVYMLGAYFGMFAATLWFASSSPVVQGIAAMLAAMIACAVLGVIIERVAYRPVRRSGRLAALITAIGVSMLIENGWQSLPFVGSTPRAFQVAGTENPLRIAIGGVRLILDRGQGIVLLAALLLTLLLVYIVRYTTVGKAIRAVSYDREAAALMGINTDAVISATFFIGSALAGAAGWLNHGLTRQNFDPLLGIPYGLKAFIAAVLGGIGNIGGAVLGGLLMGVSESFVGGSSLSSFRDAFAFLILIAVLIFRPSGLLGQNVVEKV